jgi:AcrR family transcriptional regulator
MAKGDGSDGARIDPRTERTLSAIWEAFLGLIEAKGYEATSVQDIARGAKVNRATFYRYYEDKADLFRQGTVALLDSMIGRMRLPEIGDPRSAIDMVPEYFSRMFALLHEEWDAFEILSGPRSHPEFRAIVGDKIESFIFDKRLKAWFSGPASFEEPAMAEAYACTIAGTLTQLALWWLGSAEPLPPERVGSIYKTIIVGSLKELLAEARAREDGGAKGSREESGN